MIIGGGAVALFLVNSPTTDTRIAAAIYLGLNLLWWIPTLCRSVALRGVERAWRGGLRQTYAALRNEPPKWLRVEGLIRHQPQASRVQRRRKLQGY